MTFAGRGQSLLSRAAETEARRRLIVTAIALERYRGRHGSYPTTLQALVPELLPKLPMDFMDGKPLRYRVTGDGHFVLYSVGLDCVDNGGKMQGSARPRDSYGDGPPFRTAADADLVWPRPASAEESEIQHQVEKKALAEQRDSLEERQADYYWRRTTRRQAKAQALLQAPPQPITKTKESAYRGRPLSEVLRNRAASGTNHLTLTEMLTLRQVFTGAEPESATFELPIAYDVLTNLGSLHLFIDFTGAEDADSDEGFQVGQFECERATNGNCLLVWNTIYEAPGIHALQAGLALEAGQKSDDNGKPVVPLGPDGLPFSHTISSEELSGPLTPIVVSNLCQFSLGSAYFNPAFGATLRAKLLELSGRYSADMKLPAGKVLKTITGSTSNGVITVHWDLTDEHGQVCTNQAYDSVFHIELPDSGRSQTLKGP
jgi:hypothetical protein